MKRLLSLLLALAMMFALAACSSSSSDDADEAEDTATEETDEEATEEEETETEEADEDDASEEESTETEEVDLSGEDYYEFSMSTSQVDGNWYATLMDEFAEAVYEATDGHISITAYHNNTLGDPEDIYNGMVNGTIDIVNLGMSQAGDFPVNDIVQIPFLCEDPYEALAVLNALYDAGYMTEYTDNGFQLLSFHPTDIQMFCFVDDQVESIEDFSGLNIRVNSGSIVDVVELFGATAVSIETTDVYMSLTTGVVDGAVSSPAAMTAFAFNDACTYLYEVPLAIGCNYLCISDYAWDSLSETLQGILQDVADEYQDLYMEANIEAMNESIEAFEVVYEPTEEVLDEMRELSASIKDEWADNISAEGYDGDAIMALAEETLEAYRAG